MPISRAQPPPALHHSMTYFLRRLLTAIPTFFALIAVSFFMIRLAPGGPFDANPKTTPEVRANLARFYHLDEPLWMQFGRYLRGVLHLDFGPSFRYRDYTVSELLLRGFPVSAAIGVCALVLATVGGISIGTLAALRPNSKIDQLIVICGMLAVAVPASIVAPLLQLLFSIWLHWLPAAGWDGSVRRGILPILALSLPPIAAISQLTRNGMIESLQSNHVRTAMAKGLGVRLTLWRHALPGGLLGTLAYLGPATAGILTGSVVVERAFAIPGIGRYFVEAASNRDYTLVMGTVIFYGALLIVANLIVDLTYAGVDPRVRHE